jgi:hypothetical protein
LSSYEWPATGGSGGGVTSINTLTGPIIIAAGTGVSLATAGNTLTLSSPAILSINSDTTQAQTLSVGTAGTNFAIVDAGGGSHVFNLPTASATNRGALSSSDWTTFNSKQAAGNYLTAISVVSANGFTGSSSGGLTPAITLSTSITGILQGNGTAISAATVGNITSSPTTNLVVTGGTGAVIGSGTLLTLTGASLVEATSSVLTITGATNAVLGTGVSIQVKQASTSQSGYLSSTDWNTFNGKGSGSVTSVTFTGDGTVLSSTPSSAVTASGTVTASLKTQTAGTFFAGPTSGSAAAPTFRALQSPTIQKFTSGTAQTYTTAAGALYIRVRMVGGGGGGGGTGTVTQTAGGTGTASTFGTALLVANPGVGGGAGASDAGSPGGAGGTASLGTGPVGTALTGGSGSGTADAALSGVAGAGGGGGSNALGGGAGDAMDSVAGSAAAANTGGGGSGAGSGGTVATSSGAGGGGASGFVDAIISSPAATYTYTVGVAGAAGTAGTAGQAGGAGAAGYIEVTEYYQ